MPTNPVRLDARAIVRCLAIAIGMLASAHLITQVLKYRAGLPEVYGLVPLFDMGEENNLPTFFSGGQLLLCALLLYLIARTRAGRHPVDFRYWAMLALIFFWLAADEMASMHELAIRPVAEWMPGRTTGFLHWGWVVPGSLLVIIVAIAYARFVLKLPASTRNRTIVGAALFVGGAIGVEMPEAAHVEQHGMENLTYGLFVLVEETLEMAGILVFLSGLLIYVRDHVGRLEVTVVSPVAQRTASSRLAPHGADRARSGRLGIPGSPAPVKRHG